MTKYVKEIKKDNYIYIERNKRKKDVNRNVILI